MVSSSGGFGWSIVCLAAVWTASSAPAQQTVFTDEVTVTATGTERPVDEVPLPVTVITRTEIDDSQEESVADLLRRVPGVVVARSGDEGAAASLFVRGTESDHTLVMFDGVRLTSPYFGGYDWSLLPTAGLDRVEVARGPFSALWGADAVGGVVNLVPGRSRDGLEAVIRGEAGSDEWRRLEGAVGWAGGGFDVYASGFEREGRGELANSDFDFRQGLLDAGWSWREGSRVALISQDLTAATGIPFSSPGSPTPERRQRTEQRLVALPLRLAVASGWDLELVASRVERELTFRDPDDPFGFTSSDTRADTDQVRLASRHELGRHVLTWGGEWRSDRVDDITSYGVNLADRASTVAGAFAQDVWRPAARWQLVAGLRRDAAAEWGSQLSPRLAVGWRPHGDLELRAAYGEAFRQPSIGELYFPFYGNPELAAESSRSLEAGVGWSALGSRFQVNLFTTGIDNLVDFDTASSAFVNVASADIRGAELAWDRALTGALTSSFQATWLDTEDAVGERLLRRPGWSAGWTVAGALAPRLRGDLTLLWIGARDDRDAVSFERIRLAGHLTADVALAFELVHGLEATLRIHNLTDQRYEEVAGYPAPRRRVAAGLRWRL